jgi:nitrogen regulatory protein PII-like uncharacterized protein
MTAEIVIMNKEAVALASDSAVTSIGRGGNKIFTSANKLFSLSKYNPVGVMVYGNAKIMDVPWEILVKAYRIQLDKKEFNNLEEYADDFVEYINNSRHLFPEDVQERYFKTAVESYFKIIKDEIKARIKSVIDSRNSVTEEEIVQIVSQVVEEHMNECRKAKSSPSAPENCRKLVIEKFGEFFNES